MGLNPIQRHPILSIRMPPSWTPIQLMALVQCQVNPIQRALDGQTVNPPPRTQDEKVDYMMKHLECFDRQKHSVNKLSKISLSNMRLLSKR